MQFNEKLIYLMDLTGTSNKKLAAGINVDPSMISLIRTGRRGKPRNEEHIRAMAAYFSERITTSFQRERLASEIGHYNLKYGTDFFSISDLIFDWLCKEDYLPQSSAGDILAEFNRSDTELKNPAKMEISGTKAVSSIYYGQDGFYLALQDFYNHLLALPQPKQLYISMDGNCNWYQDNKSLASDVRYWKKNLLEKGMKICQILPPTSVEPYYDTIIHWIPLYMTGQVEVLYYPRMRDQVFRSSLLIVPGEIGLIVQMMAGDPKPVYSFLVTMPELITSTEYLFHKFKSMCRRAMTLRRNPDEISECFIRYTSYSGDCIQLTSCLPQTTLPDEVLTEFLHRSLSVRQTIVQGELHQYLDRLSQESNISDLTIDLSPLASPDEVRAGEVVQIVAGSQGGNFYTYTVHTYAAHLKNIIRRLRSNPNYYFIPFTRSGSPVKENILVKRDHYAILLRTEPPISVFELTEPDLILPFYEYLMSIAEKGHLTLSGKQQIIHRLENLLSELE